MTRGRARYALVVTLHDAQRLSVAAIAFDSDGVLVDSTASVEQAWARWAAELGLDAREVIEFAHGHRSRETVDQYVDEARRAIFQDKVDGYELDDAPSVTALPGALTLTAAIPRDRWGVVTSGTRVLATARLSAAGIPAPPFVVTADDVVRGKPHPEGYLAAIARLGVDPAQVAVAEDSPAGIAAAIAAGAGTGIGIGPGAISTGASLVVRDLAALYWDGGLVVDPAGRLR